MAADLAGSAAAGVADPTVRRRSPGQLRCVRIPERRLVFDVNDFDEALPGPSGW
jgi:hypothetical protein